MKHTPIRKTVDSFAYRTEACPECGGFGTVTSAVDSGPIGCGYFRDDVCDECDGEGEVPAMCADCCEVKPINDDGVCRECAALDLAYSELNRETRTQWL